MRRWFRNRQERLDALAALCAALPRPAGSLKLEERARSCVACEGSGLVGAKNSWLDRDCDPGYPCGACDGTGGEVTLELSILIGAERASSSGSWAHGDSGGFRPLHERLGGPGVEKTLEEPGRQVTLRETTVTY